MKRLFWLKENTPIETFRLFPYKTNQKSLISIKGSFKITYKSPMIKRPKSSLREKSL